MYKAPDTFDEMLEDAEDVGIMADEELDMDIRSLREFLIYGMKGMAAYAHHAHILEKTDDKVSNFFIKD